MLRCAHGSCVTATDDLPPQEVNKLVLFYAIRVSFAVACSLIETRLLCSVRRVLGTSVAHWMLLFLGLSAGMGHAAQAFLPQTFTMMAVMLTLDAWMVSGKHSQAAVKPVACAPFTSRRILLTATDFASTC